MRTGTESISISTRTSRIMFSHSFVGGSKSASGFGPLGTYPRAGLDWGEYISTSGFGPGGYICEPVWTGGNTNPPADLDRGYISARAFGLDGPNLVGSKSARTPAFRERN